MTTTPVDLSNCDREPIHIPGAVQPHGALLACRESDLLVSQASDSVRAHLGVEPDALLGRSVASVVTEATWADIAVARDRGFPRESNPLTVELRDGAVFDTIVHHSPTPGVVILELEPRRDSLTGFHPRMRASVGRLQTARDHVTLCDIASQEIRALTGFDRVMVYRFDADWNGEVVSEAKRDDLEPFLGLHYPASDIPAQARRLYALNWLRIIPHVSYRPSPLVPKMDPESHEPLNLSFSVLRSVSPIHIEYLHNMGVTASMSISLVRDSELIGLIACHHYSGPHHVGFTVRETSEYLGQVLSWHLATLDSRVVAERVLKSKESESYLISGLATADTISEGLCRPALLELTAATGAALVYDGDVHTVGIAPERERILRLVRALNDLQTEPLIVTDKLRDLIPEAQSWDDVAAGLLAVEIAKPLGEYILWFRSSTERTVNWAGDPTKTFTVDEEGAPRLSPRRSFALWREAVRGRALPWERWQVEAASGLRRLLVGAIRKRAAELRVVNEQLSVADRAKDDFLATVSHELRTPLNAVLGWVQMLQSGELPPDRRDRALSTIERNARVQAQLIEDLLDVTRIITGKLTLSLSPISLGAIAEQAVETVRPGADAKGIRLHVAIDSTATIIGDAQRLQQVLVNLLNNAIKFTPSDGRVQLTVEKLDVFAEIIVADNGQGISQEFLPDVFDRFRQADSSQARRAGGLGIGLAIVKTIVELHGGSVAAGSEGIGRGATFTVRLPVSLGNDRPTGRPSRQPDETPEPSLHIPRRLKGLRVLLIDDEVDSTTLLEAQLTRFHTQVATATSVAEGLRLVDEFRPDVIVCDIGMPDVDGYAFIAQLRARPARDGGETPAVALTSYARGEDRARAIDAGFQSHIPKPFDPIRLAEVIGSLVAGHPS